ncbi:MAG: hypothetical protein O3A51_02590 [Verrucomicrobia bacterium]|nr:hypothetical protein [Verrucomicrobiota bacterium]
MSMTRRQWSAQRHGRVTIVEMVLVLLVCLVAWATYRFLAREPARETHIGESGSRPTAPAARPAPEDRSHPEPDVAQPIPDDRSLAAMDDPFDDDDGGLPGTLVTDDPHRTFAPVIPPAVRDSVEARILARDMNGHPDWDAIKRVVASLEPEELLAAWDVALALPWSPDRDAITRELLARITHQDPNLAMDLALGQESQRLRRAAIDAVSEAWADLDPAGALAMLLAGKTDDQVPIRLNPAPIFRAMFARDADEAMATLATLNDDRMREDAIRGIFVDADDPMGSRDRLIGALTTMEDDNVRRAAAEVIIEQWATVAPYEAAEWVASLDDSMVREHAIVEMAREWGRVAPGESIRWLAAMTETPAIRAAAEATVGSWFRDDPIGVWQWLDTADSSPLRDAVAASYVDASRRRDPAGAFLVAASISDMETRYKYMDQAAHRWMRRDPTRAIATILASDMPDAIKNKYVTRVIKD